jgi:hypothetical protein
MRNRILGVLVGAIVLLASPAAWSATVAVSNQVINGEFASGLTPGWTTVGTTGVIPNIRPGSDSINAGGGSGDQPDVFDIGNKPFFSSGSFAVLGDASGKITTSGSTDTSGLSILKQTITLASKIGNDTVNFYNMTLSFRWVFDGVDTSELRNDSFSATLAAGSGNILVGNGALISSTTGGGGDDDEDEEGIGQRGGNFTRDFKLAPGTYILTFKLDENSSQRTNTAVGIDSVSLLGTADTSPVPLPPAVWLLGSTFLGMMGIVRRRNAQQGSFGIR